MERILPDVIYRVARRDKTTLQITVCDDFYNLKTVQTTVKQLDSESEEHLDYYIDAVRLNQLPSETLLNLLDQKLITRSQFEQATREKRM